MTASSTARAVTLMFCDDPSAVDLKDLVDASGPAATAAARYTATATAPVGSAPLTQPGLIVLESEGGPVATPDVVGGATVLGAVTVTQSRDAHPADDGHTALLVVLVTNLDTARQDDYERWYDEVHMPEVLGTGTYRASARLTPDERAGADTLALYATDWEDPDDALSTLFSNNGNMTMWEQVDTHHVGSYRLQERYTR